MTTTFSYYRGEPVLLDLVVTDHGGHDIPGLALTMRLKPAPYGVAPSRDTAAAATFDVAYHAPEASLPGYWRAQLPDGTSAGLTPGTYVTDGQLRAGAAVMAVTDPLFIRISESVTPA
ncbi:MAG: hypothetical protein KGN34_02795 [Sphingomonadales bacterium]|nr:hypothetical protein [Sphingomonadales bacterium]